MHHIQRLEIRKDNTAIHLLRYHLASKAAQRDLSQVGKSLLSEANKSSIFSWINTK
jgi:hypothetical protein